MAFYEVLKNLRKDRGYTQRTFAAKIGVSPQAVSRWEKGEDTPSLSRYAAMARALGVPITDLLENAPDARLYSPVKLCEEEMILAPLVDRGSLQRVAPGWHFKSSLDLIKIAGPGVQIPRTVFRRLEVDRPPYCVEVDGDNLDTAGINNGDIAVVNAGEVPEQGALAFVSVYGMVSFKYIYRLGDAICLRSDCGDMRLTPAEQKTAAFCVHGVVVSVLKGRPRPRPF